ncbi:unnamed protein product [marine sediment metagenome]|uniref:Rubredoxin-like domain-containing protein n=1 Tax=marine sediment metagenome TaxID=412755 RepID=X1CLW1_9ZZZZ
MPKQKLTPYERNELFVKQNLTEAFCGSCGDSDDKDAMYFYPPDGEWYHPECLPSLRKCEICGTVYDEDKEKVCPECDKQGRK